MSYIVTWSEQLGHEIDATVRLAADIWKPAGADFTRLAITAGNVASYGAYIANYQRTNGLIQFSIHNRSSVLKIDANRQLVASTHCTNRDVCGVLLHEIGHHVEHAATACPWSKVKPIGPSTHVSASWIWICCIGRNYFQPDRSKRIDPETLAKRIASDHRDAWINYLRCWSPFAAPPPLMQIDRRCDHCQAAISLNARSDARFCSVRCRIAASRQQKRDIATIDQQQQEIVAAGPVATAGRHRPHPLRVYRSRRKGARLPAGAVCVTRPSRWGNKYPIDKKRADGHYVAAEQFRRWVESQPQMIADIQAELRGKQLACYCPLDRPCHADVLAEIANR